MNYFLINSDTKIDIFYWKYRGKINETR
jgi:hypothetical protein